VGRLGHGRRRAAGHRRGSDRIDRRTALGRLLALTLLTPPAVGVLAACGRHGDQSGMGDGGMSGWMMSGDGMMDGQMMADMPAIHDLLVRDEAISTPG
jgi:hypothetical protein